MCGVVGLVRLGAPLDPAHRSTLEEMAGTLFHRGPDSWGLVEVGNGSVGLAHRRLSIVDLSPAGHQPMSSRSGRWTISYNGEMYNTSELRHRLAAGGSVFRGRSDTEVLVEALDSWGVDRTLRAVDGMFAFAAFDSVDRTLWLCRDRFGEKPLYFARQGELLLVASELRALEAVPDLHLQIDDEGLRQVLEFGYSMGETTIFRDVRRVMAGTSVRFDTRSGEMSVFRYWDAVSEARNAKLTRSPLEPVEVLESLLFDSVRSRMISDVPLGAFLSGGVDSSLVVAAMTHVSRQKPRTFTIGFPEVDFDESRYASAVSLHLGTEHTEFTVSHREAIELIPTLGSIPDEPFADSSLLPTFIVSRLAREHVTVALSGDGGDELFGGYDRYRVLQRLSRVEQFVPARGRQALGNYMTSRSWKSVDSMSESWIGRVMPSWLRRRTGSKMTKLGHLLAGDSGEAYRRMMSVNTRPERMIGENVHLSEVPYHLESLGAGWSPSEKAMLLDTGCYLPDDLLTKVDRASMAVSLEVRSPFLNPELFRFAWSLDPNLRVGSRGGKVVLRQLLGKYLPSDLIDRPKMGFGVPIGPWLRGPLRSWADGVLDPEALRESGCFDASAVHGRWLVHRSGELDLSQELWPVLMTQSWMSKRGIRR